jgi:transposase
MSVAIEVVDTHEQLLGRGRYVTDKAGYAVMWSSGPTACGRSREPTAQTAPRAQRLLAAGERDVEVPARLEARVRLFDTGHNRKTDPLDALSIAVVSVRTEGLRVLT